MIKILNLMLVMHLFQNDKNEILVEAACPAPVSEGFDQLTPTTLLYESSSTTGNVNVGTVGDYFAPKSTTDCRTNNLNCIGVRDGDMQMTSLNGVDTVDYTATSTQTSGLGFTDTSNQVQITLSSVSFCPYADLEARIICYSKSNSDTSDRQYAIFSVKITVRLTAVAQDQASVPSFTVTDFSSLTMAYQVDAANDISIYTSFSEYASCTQAAYPVQSSAGNPMPTYFSGSSGSGAVSFTRATTWSETFVMRICYDIAETNCVLSTSSFTITVTACDATMASGTTITYPTALSNSNAYVQYVIDGNRPVFTSFGGFTTDTDCQVTSVELYSDTSKTAHTLLEISYASSSWTPQVINSANYQTETDYTFTLLLVLTSGAGEQWASVSCDSGTCTTFTLNTYINCNTYLTFTTYSATSSTSLTLGTSGQTSQIQSAGSNYVTTSDASLCPITSYSVTVTTGSNSDVTLSTTSGSFSVSIATAQTITIQITACAASSTDALDCKTSASTEFVIASAGCASSLSDSGWATNAPTNPIEIGAASSTIVIQSQGADYITTSDSSGCPITSYSITETASSGSGGTITCDPTSGAITATKDSIYSKTFTVTACANSLTDAANCFTSTNTYSVTVSLTQCDTWLSFGTIQSWTNPIAAGATGSSQTLKTASSYASSSLSACTITGYYKNYVSSVSGIGDLSEVSIVEADGKLDISTDTEYSGQFTITVCANSATSGTDCITSSNIQVTVSLNPGCSSLITFGDWSLAMTNPIAYAAGGSDVTIQSAGLNYFSTTNSGLCPLTSYSIAEASSGTLTHTTIASDGAVNAAINQVYTESFQITACSNNPPGVNDCTTSPTQQVIVEISACNVYLSFIGWTPLVTNPIELSSTAGTTTTLQSLGSSYASTSEPTNCQITSYSINDPSGKVTIDALNGAVTALIDSSYTSIFTITICARSSNVISASADCLTSSGLTVVVTNSCGIAARTTLPSSAETTTSSDFVINGTDLTVNKTSYVNGLTNYEVDCSLFFSYNCALTQFEILEIWNTTGGRQLLSSDHSTYVDFNTATGLLKFIKFNEVVDFFIKVRAYDGNSWSSSTTNAQIRFIIEAPIVVELNFDLPEIIVPEDTPTEQETEQQQQVQIEQSEKIFPPSFLTSPSCPSLSVDLQNPKNDFYICQIPDYSPSSKGKSAQLSIQNNLEAIEFNSKNRQILIDLNKLTKGDIGSQLIELKIFDDAGQSTIAKVYIEITEIESGLGDQVEVVQKKNLTSRIDSINSMGQMVVLFSDDINNVTFQHINSSVWDLYIEPAQQRHLLEENFDISNLNFTWKTKNWQQNQLMFELNFSNPLHISPKMEQDTIVMHLIHPENASLFYAPALKKSLHDSTWTMRSSIRKQMPQNQAAKQLNDKGEDLKGLMMTFLVISIVLYLMSNGGSAMRYMFIMVRSLQLILHLPMVQIAFPGNTMTLISIIIPVVGFDVLESTLDWEWVDSMFPIFDFNEHELVGERLFNQLTDIGYETFNSLMILNTIGFIFLFLVLKILFWVIMMVVAKLCGSPKLKNWLDQMGKNIFFGDIFELYIQGMMEFLIAAILSTKMPQYALIGEMISYGISYTSFFVVLVFLPASCIYVIISPYEKLLDPNFFKRWGQLYQNMYEKRKDRSARFFYFLFVIRRIIFIFMAFMLQYEALCYQLLIIEFLNGFMLIYQGQVRPAYGTFENRLELFNEFCVAISSIMIIQFTDWIDDVELQYEIGWYMCGLILFQVLVNLVIIIYYSVRRLYIVYLKMKGLCLRRLSKHFKCIKPPKPVPSNQSLVSQASIQSQEQQNLEQSRAELKRRIADMEKFQKEKRERANSRLSKEEQEKRRIELEKIAEQQRLKDFMTTEIMIKSHQLPKNLGPPGRNKQKVQSERNNSGISQSKSSDSSNSSQPPQELFGLGINIIRSQNEDPSKNKGSRKKRIVQGMYYLPKRMNNDNHPNRLSVITEESQHTQNRLMTSEIRNKEDD